MIQKKIAREEMRGQYRKLSADEALLKEISEALPQLEDTVVDRKNEVRRLRSGVSAFGVQFWSKLTGRPENVVRVLLTHSMSPSKSPHTGSTTCCLNFHPQSAQLPLKTTSASRARKRSRPWRKS